MRNVAALDSFGVECQFLPFQSEYRTLRELFESVESVGDRSDDKNSPWYVGFSNCHPIILNELRTMYPIPHFLPADAEVPNTDYIFLGYDEGAVMHVSNKCLYCNESKFFLRSTEFQLDYIPRLMWQAQLQGNKSWTLNPPPECDSVCSSFEFYVEPGDAVLIDTRNWYHSTTILDKRFSITIQSEYG